MSHFWPRLFSTFNLPSRFVWRDQTCLKATSKTQRGRPRRWTQMAGFTLETLANGYLYVHTAHMRLHYLSVIIKYFMLYNICFKYCIVFTWVPPWIFHPVSSSCHLFNLSSPAEWHTEDHWQEEAHLQVGAGRVHLPWEDREHLHQESTCGTALCPWR